MSIVARQYYRSFFVKNPDDKKKIEEIINKFIIIGESETGDSLCKLDLSFEETEYGTKCCIILPTDQSYISIIPLNDIEEKIGFRIDVNDVSGSCEENDYDIDDLEDFDLGEFDVEEEFKEFEKTINELLDVTGTDIFHYSTHCLENKCGENTDVKIFVTKKLDPQTKQVKIILNEVCCTELTSTDVLTFFPNGASDNLIDLGDEPFYISLPFLNETGIANFCENLNVNEFHYTHELSLFIDNDNEFNSYTKFEENLIYDLKSKEILKNKNIEQEDLQKLKNKVFSNYFDKNFVLEAVKKEGFSLRYASDRLKADREVVLEAVKQYPGALEYADDSLKEDPELMKLAAM